MKKDRRDASSRSLMRYAAPGATFVRIALDAEQEVRADQNPFDSLFNAGIEAALLPCLPYRRTQGVRHPNR